MRVQNTVKNMIASVSSNIIIILVGLIAQSIFIKTLGPSILGLNGLFTNLITMLSIVEIGIGDAIIYSLYKPIAHSHTEEIKSLMRFYQKSYHVIGFIVFSIGLVLIPFLPFFVNESLGDLNIAFIFLLFVIDVTLSYFLSYKRSILYANQKNYMVNIIHIAYTLLLNAVEIAILLWTHNYYLYLFIKIGMRLLENIVITICANKMYPYLKEKAKPLAKKTEKEIFKKVGALFFHKIAAFVVLGTDNIMISKFLGLVQVGLYSSYYLVINAIQTLLSQVVTATTAGVGNLLVTESKEKHYEVFSRIQFLNFWLASFGGTALFVLFQDFIIVWIGKDFLLPTTVVLVLVISFFFSLMRNSYLIFKSAAGIFYEDRFVPVAEAVLNIILSYIFLRWFGLAGVFLGTIISGMVLYIYSYPKFVYQALFGKDYKKYAVDLLKYVFVFAFVLGLTYFIASFCTFSSPFLSLLVKTVICLLVPNLCVVLLFYRSVPFQKNWNVIMTFLRKYKRKYEKNSA